jgi:hypothetical protein
MASPYLHPNADQIAGAIHGLKGGAAYEALRDSVGDATRRLDPLAAGHVAIIGLMIVGALVHAVIGARGEGG